MTAHGETETLDLKTPKNSLFPFNRNALERNWEQNSHSYKDVHDGKPIRIWIVIRTEMCIDENTYNNNMDSHSYRNVHDENPYKKNMDSHSYKDVHDENP